VYGLFAARLAFNPGDGQALGPELSRSQEQVRYLPAPVIPWTLLQSLNVHQ
jgi:hypothetical protein